MYCEEITGVVIDIGSDSVRAGYSGDDAPHVYIPSVCIFVTQSLKLM